MAPRAPWAVNGPDNLGLCARQTVGPEKNPDREALMATLSCAMVGPMDGINLLNKTRVMASARADGYILKPDRPLMSTDACFKGATPDPTCATCGVSARMAHLRSQLSTSAAC